MTHQTATELLDLLRTGRASASELLGEAIGRIEAGDGAINAVVVRDFDRARAAAGEADAARARGEARPLLGLPMTVKEAFNVAGLPTTWGLPGTECIPVGQDAVVVARLKAAGAVVLGKTNVAAMLADWQCANPLYGRTSNPWDLARTSGGSSGGGAAAVAAGFSALEYGSDLSASLRAPAAFCGVYAHKPSQGLVPMRGFAPPGTPVLSQAPTIDLAALGPIARSAEDLELALRCTAGPDDHQALAYRLALPEPRRERLGDFRVLVLDRHPLVPTAGAVRDAIRRRADALSRAGCRIGEGEGLVPDLEELSALFVLLLMALFSADSSDEAFDRARAAAEALPAGAAGLPASAVRGPALSHREWLRADRRRVALADHWRRLFADWDAVLCPAMPTIAYPHMPDEGRPRRLAVDGAMMDYEAQPLWAAVSNLTGLPATVFPLGLDAAGLPLAAQLIGPFLEDLTPIRLAGLMAREFGGFTTPALRAPQGA